jgi:hypothetical protein
MTARTFLLQARFEKRESKPEDLEKIELLKRQVP